MSRAGAGTGSPPAPEARAHHREPDRRPPSARRRRRATGRGRSGRMYSRGGERDQAEREHRRRVGRGHGQHRGDRVARACRASRRGSRRPSPCRAPARARAARPSRTPPRAGPGSAGRACRRRSGRRRSRRRPRSAVGSTAADPVGRAHRARARRDLEARRSLVGRALRAGPAGRRAGRRSDRSPGRSRRRRCPRPGATWIARQPMRPSKASLATSTRAAPAGTAAAKLGLEPGQRRAPPGPAGS